MASYYLDYGVLDSAVQVAEDIQGWASEALRSLWQMDFYLKHFERSQSQSDAKEYSERAKSVLEKLLDKDPANLLLKNKLAMTLVTSENPMAGITMLEGDSCQRDENNRLAILNLGLLSIQSGQFDRAKERFEKLVSLDPLDQEAKLYLAVSMIEINEQSQARLLLEEIVSSTDSIPAIKMMAQDYLKGL